MAVVFACICAWRFGSRWCFLEEATPDPGDYHPEPEWYFCSSFRLLRLKIFAGEFGQFLGADCVARRIYGAPGRAALHRSDPERNIFKRPIALIGWMVVMAIILIFTVSAIINREFLD